jgi:hypothetical protein
VIGAALDYAFDRFMQDVVEKVEEFAWVCQGVGAAQEGDPEGPVPHFSYTVGWHAKGWPEAIVFALPFEVAHHYLTDIWNQLNAGELTLEVGDTVPMRSGRDDTPPYEFAVLPVTDSWRDLTVANRYAGSNPEGVGIEAVQLVWPDANGLYPWQDGAEIGGWIPLEGPVPESLL